MFANRRFADKETSDPRNFNDLVLIFRCNSSEREDLVAALISSRLSA